MKLKPNAIFQTDFLPLLERVEPETITLVYLDPPFFSEETHTVGRAGYRTIDEYLSFISLVLRHSRQTLKNSGSLFFHSEPRTSGIIRSAIDNVFGRETFVSEIIWPRNVGGKFGNRRPRSEHDSIFHYSKTEAFIYHEQHRKLRPEEINNRTTGRDERGSYVQEALTVPVSKISQRFEWRGFNLPEGLSWRFTLEKMEQLVGEGRIIFPSQGRLPVQKRYLDETEVVGSIWNDISPTIIAREQPKYPAQKPVELLGRIIKMSSNEGDIVLDPFCGSGTTLVAAQENDRKWIGGDSVAEAYSRTISRLEKSLGLNPGLDFLNGSQAHLEKDFLKCNTVENGIGELEQVDIHEKSTKQYAIENKFNFEPPQQFNLHEQSTLLSASPLQIQLNHSNYEGIAASPWRNKLEVWLHRNPKTMSVELKQLREEFVQRFPKDQLMDLTLEQYALGLENSRDSFCYWLEFKTRDLGSIRGGSAAKFGVWRSGEEWRWNKIYQSPEDALFHIKKGLTMLISAVEEERFDELDKIGREQLGKLRYSLRCKPLYLYFPNELLPISSLEHLGFFLKEFGIKPQGEVLARNRQLLKLFRSLPEFEGFDTQQIMRFLYENFPIAKEVAVPTEDFAKSRLGKLPPTQSIKTINQSTVQNISGILATQNKATGKRDPYRLVGLTLAGKYRLDEYAGGGGMGAVYRSYALNLDKLVAVKILKPDVLVRDPNNATLFEREVKAAQRLSHPHIVKVFDSGNTPDDISFMVMEWLDGQTLEEIVVQGQLSLDRVLAIFEQICDAFDLAHRSKVIHLDVKPANIFLVSDRQPEDFVKVIDFGMAKVLSNESGTTVTRFMGTYQYCSPEHFGGKVSSRSDVYSLGATLYYLLSGLVPFGTSYIHAKLHPNLDLPPVPSILRVRQDLPEAVEKVIERALNKKPGDRQQSVKELFTEFHQALNKSGKSKDSKQIHQQEMNLLSTLLTDTLVHEPVSPISMHGIDSAEDKSQQSLEELPKAASETIRNFNYGSPPLFDYQLRIIDSATEATLRAMSTSNDKRAGIIWQTQGTGLSITTAHYLSQLIGRPELRGHLFIVATDRVDIAHQLWARFSEHFQHLTVNATYIDDNNQLATALTSGQYGLIVTTVQRLQKLPTSIVSIGDNVVLVGYNLHGYGEHVAKLFSQTTSILFTNNPILEGSPAQNIFGELIYKYTLEQAINDTVVSPIRIERRLIEVQSNINDYSTGGAQRRVTSKLESSEFLWRVAEDIVNHFESRYQTTHGKALIVVPNRDIAAILYKNIMQAYSELRGETDTSESIKIISSALNPEERMIFTRRFKDPTDPFKLAITSGMWLTGLDIPPLNTIYLLKPMSQTNLLQVISRVARISRDVKFGLVVDYLGLTSML